MVDVIRRERRILDLLLGQVARELMHYRTYHLHVRELLGAYRSNSNVPFPVFMDEHGSVCFQIHSISTFERVRKYDENSKAQSAEIPYIIEIGNTKRMINIYALSSSRFEAIFE